MRTCVFEYTPKGVAVSDFEVKQLATEYVRYINDWLNYDGEPQVFFYSTSNIFFALKEKVAKGEIDHKHILFRFEGKDITINEYGSIVDWPKGFCDIETSLSESTLLAAQARLRVKIFEAEDR
jgi:hypothetical protein